LLLVERGKGFGKPVLRAYNLALLVTYLFQVVLASGNFLAGISPFKLEFGYFFLYRFLFLVELFELFLVTESRSLERTVFIQRLEQGGSHRLMLAPDLGEAGF